MNKKINLVVLFSLFSLEIFSQTPTWQWATSMGGMTNDEGYSITLDASNNVYTTGYFVGTTDFDPGPGIYNLTDTGTFISKLDASGNFIWVKAIKAIGAGPGSGVSGYTIALDASGNIYTTGFFEGTVDFDPGVGTYNLTAINNADVFVSKWDSSGNFVWAKSMSGIAFGYVVSVYLVLDASSNVYITGYFADAVDFDPGVGTFILTTASSLYDDTFICKLDSSGNFAWAKSFTGLGNSYSNFIALDALDNVYVTGSFSYGPIDFDPGVGVFNLTSSGYADIFVSKLDSSGNFVWAKKLGGTDDEYGLSTVVDASLNVYTTGWFQGIADFDPGLGAFNLTSVGSSDIFISKLDASGNFIWAKAIGGIDVDAGISITLDSSNNVYIAGEFSAVADFDPNAGIFNMTAVGNQDIFVCRLNSAGNFVWAKSVGGVNEDRVIAITVDDNGNLYSTGSFFSPSIICNSDTLTNADNSGTTYDIFIAKLTGNCSAFFGVYPDTTQLHTYWAVNNASGTPPLSYDWDWGDGGPHDFTAYPNHTYAVAGFYTICLSVTDGGGCSNAYCDTFTLARMNTTNTMVYVNVVASIPTSIAESLEPSISIFPNPTNEAIVLRFNNEAPYTVKLSDAFGKILFEATTVLDHVNIDMRNFRKGIYFVVVIDEGYNSVIRKIVKM